MSTRREVSSSMTSPSSGNAAEQFLVGDWNSLVSLNQDVEFNGSSGLASYNVRHRQSQENCSLDPMVEQFPGCSPFNYQSNLGTVNSFDLLKSAQTASTLCPPDFNFANKQCTERNNKGKKRKNMSECSALHPHSPQDLVRSNEAEHLKIVSPESIKSPEEKKEKKQKSENSGGITRQTNAKHAMECSQDGEATKEDYIHVRAKRGQATNSHSLAERVRREKISERMRLLQDLVPGCNKITGKAMMLDEIINYVQSLQRQVEFLSMKLAAVNPELQYDIDQIISKDILQSGDGGLAVFGCGPGMSTLHPHLQGSSSHGIMHPEMLICNAPNSGDMMRSSIHNSMAQLQGVWDDELQTALQMGLIPNLSAVASDLNCSMKMEL